MAKGSVWQNNDEDDEEEYESSEEDFDEENMVNPSLNGSFHARYCLLQHARLAREDAPSKNNPPWIFFSHAHCSATAHDALG